MTDLGTLGGMSYAIAINDRGQVIGYSDVGAGVWHAFLWEKGTMVDLGTLPGTTFSIPRAINSQGQIIGASYTPGDVSGGAFLWEAGAMTELKPVPGQSGSAIAINRRGDVVGSGYRDGGDLFHATLWTKRSGRFTTNERSGR